MLKTAVSASAFGFQRPAEVRMKRWLLSMATLAAGSTASCNFWSRRDPLAMRAYKRLLVTDRVSTGALTSGSRGPARLDRPASIGGIEKRYWKSVLLWPLSMLLSGSMVSSGSIS
jgi:hypothetical protein